MPTSRIYHLLSCFRGGITTIHGERTHTPAIHHYWDVEYLTHRQRLEMSLWLNGASESLCRTLMARLTTHWWLSAQRARQLSAGAARCVWGFRYHKVARRKTVASWIVQFIVIVLLLLDYLYSSGTRVFLGRLDPTSLPYLAKTTKI